MNDALGCDMPHHSRCEKVRILNATFNRYYYFNYHFYNLLKAFDLEGNFFSFYLFIFLFYVFIFEYLKK